MRKIDSKKGFSLVELMMAVAILGFICASVLGAFGSITKAVLSTKTKSMANSLAQEQLEVLKAQPYRFIVPTSNIQYLNQFSPPVAFDNAKYPPQALTQGGITYTIYSLVQSVDEQINNGHGTLGVSNTQTDTGMKAITVNVVWEQGGELKKYELRSIYSAVNAPVKNGTITGRITIAPSGNTGIIDAQIRTVENTAYLVSSDANGDFSLPVAPGNYTVTVNSYGYFPQTIQVDIAPNEVKTENFSLTEMDRGTLQGDVYYNDHLVISQVVGDYFDPNSGNAFEWIEIYNPTNVSMAVGNIISFKYKNSSTNNIIDMPPANIAYATQQIAPKSFYLFASATQVSFNGTNIDADAVLPANSIPTGSDPGGLQLIQLVGGNPVIIDRVGWKGPSSDPDYVEENPVSNQPLDADKQLCRRASPDDTNSNNARNFENFGPAYDSGSNSLNWRRLSSPIAPRNSSSPVLPVVAGIPAIDAFVISNDRLSKAFKPAVLNNPNSSPRARFTLLNVSTGTWSVYISKNGFFERIDNVIIPINPPPPNNPMSLPGATTVPPLNNNFTTPFIVLEQHVTQGFFSGRVTNAGGNPISTITRPNLRIVAGTLVGFTDALGNYVIPADPGTYTVVVNPREDNPEWNPDYVTATTNVTVTLGQMTANVNVTLLEGGVVNGKVTSDGSNPLDGIVMEARDGGGTLRGQAITDTSGNFQIVLPVDSYTVAPVLNQNQTYRTSFSFPLDLTSGSTVNLGVYTIKNSFGKISGHISLSGAPAQSGVMIIATQRTFQNDLPPNLNSSNAIIGGLPIYTTMVDENGFYSMDIQGDAQIPYNIYAYNTLDTAALIKKRVGLNVVGGQISQNIDFNW